MPRGVYARKAGRQAEEKAHREINRSVEAQRQADRTTELLDQIRAVMADGKQRTITVIAAAVGLKNWALTTTLVHTLVRGRELFGEMRDGQKTHYRKAVPTDFANKPAVKDIAVPEVDPLAFRQKLQSVLASGVSYDVNELVRNMRQKWPQADVPTIEELLRELIAAGEVERVPLGSTLRYRRAAHSRAEAIA